MSTNAETLPTGKSPDTADATPKKLGKYVIEKKLGQGGMGAVYLARDGELRRTVALKVLPRDKASNPTLVRRFKAEAQAAAQLRHDNIVAVYDSDEADGYLFIAMEYVDGHDLHEMISRRGTVPVKRSIEIIKQVAAALEHADQHKIVHRDIKPSNLLIRHDGVVKLTDLGLARSVDDTIETGITRAGTTVGTVDYMAPEQARSSQAADIRSDIYSLGCTWYQMLTGTPPYPEGSMTNKLQAHAVKAIPDPSSKNQNVTEGLVAVIRRMMAKKPEDRYQSPTELLQDLAASSLTKAAFSQEILNAIEDESHHAVPGRTGTVEDEAPHEPPARRKGRARGRDAADAADDVVEPRGAAAEPAAGGKSKKGAASLPPPTRRRSLENEREEQEKGPFAERFKMILLICGLIAAVGGVGWLLSGLGDAVGGSWTFSVVPKQDVVVVPEAVDRPEPVVAAVSGGTSGDSLDTSTPVAQVFGNPTAGANSNNGSSTTIATPGTVAGAGGTTATPVPTGPAISTAALARVRPADPFEPPKLTATAEPNKAAGFTVGPGAASGNHFTSLNDALLKLPADGGVIKLIGDGPFNVSVRSIVKAKQLMLLGDPQRQALIVLTPDVEGQYGRLHVQGSLEISHAHLVLDRTLKPDAAAVSMLQVDQGSLVISNSSLSAFGDSGIEVTGIRLVSGKQPQRLHARRTTVRGQMRAGVDLHASAIDAALDECFLAIGNGAVIRFEGASGLTDPQEVSRWLRAFASTLCGNGSLIDVSAEAAFSESPKTSLVFRDTLGCTASDTGRRALLNVTDWLQQPVRDQLSWQTKDSSFLGFDRLIDLGSKSSFKGDTTDSWRQFWKQSVAAHEFVPESWPQGLTDWGMANPLLFDRQELPMVARVLGSSGEYPGVFADWLNLPGMVHPEKLAAWATRATPPTLPAWKPLAGEKTRINLRDNDLAQVLAKGEWDDGATLEVIGYGICQISPIRIAGKRLKLVFRQMDGAPLKVQPRDVANPPESLFEVENGVLELQGLRLVMPEVRPRQPHWMVSANQSLLSLRDCELRGLESTSSSQRGLIRLQNTSSNDTSRTAVMVRNSLLVAPGPLVQARGAGRVFVQNSILVTNDRAVDVHLPADGDRIPFTLDLSETTISTAGSAIQIAPASLSGPCQQPARIFLDRCAIVPPASWKTGTSTPVWVACDALAHEQRQVAWWGQYNGVAREVRSLLHLNTVPPQRLDTADEWQQHWGPGHEEHLLTGADGVILTDPLPSRLEILEPTHFALHAASKAAKWAHGEPIGVNLASLANLGPRKIEVAVTKPSTKPATPKPAPSKKPSF